MIVRCKIYKVLTENDEEVEGTVQELSERFNVSKYYIEQFNNKRRHNLKKFKKVESLRTEIRNVEIEYYKEPAIEDDKMELLVIENKRLRKMAKKLSSENQMLKSKIRRLEK